MVKRRSKREESFRKAMLFSSIGDYDAARHYYERIEEISRAEAHKDFTYRNLEKLMANAALTTSRNFMSSLVDLTYYLEAAETHSEYGEIDIFDTVASIEGTAIKTNVDLISTALFSKQAENFYPRVAQVLQFMEQRGYSPSDISDMTLDFYELGKQRQKLVKQGFLEPLDYVHL